MTTMFSEESAWSDLFLFQLRTRMLILAADHTKICRTDKSYVTNRMS